MPLAANHKDFKNRTRVETFLLQQNYLGAAHWPSIETTSHLRDVWRMGGEEISPHGRVERSLRRRPLCQRAVLLPAATAKLHHGVSDSRAIVPADAARVSEEWPA